MKKLLLSLIIIFCSFYLFSDSIQISQIDNSELLLNQKIKMYISVADANGNPLKGLKQDMFTIHESVDNKNFKKIDRIYSFNSKQDYDEGVNFLLLIDNSGSMYYDMNEIKTDKTENMRITHAKNAVISFINSIKNPKDTISIGSYNTYYSLQSGFSDNKDNAANVLEDIKKPEGEEAWTEIYASLYKSVAEFKNPGRNVIIILSDGENMPYYTYTKKAHKEYGTKIYNHNEPILECQKAGISVFGINFGKQGHNKDKNLSEIASQTGGRIFDAYNPQELKDVYLKIISQIQNEYIFVYRATMDPADKKYVKVDFNANNKKMNVTRFYFSSTLFGQPGIFNLLFLLLLPLAILLLFLLSLIKFKNTNQNANLEVISTQYGRAVTKVISLNEGQTIIGGSSNANMTIVNSPTIKDKHAKIEYNKKKDTYTIIADGDTKVNNKKVSTRDLEDGDVISIGGATIVFDKGMMDKDKKKK